MLSFLWFTVAAVVGSFVSLSSAIDFSVVVKRRLGRCCRVHCVAFPLVVHRMGARSSAYGVARSEAEFIEIMDNLQEKEVGKGSHLELSVMKTSNTYLAPKPHNRASIQYKDTKTIIQSGCLHLFQANERHMRTLAVDPPALLEPEERRRKFINSNGKNFCLAPASGLTSLLGWAVCGRCSP